MAAAKTILICDDDQGMRDTLSAILKRDYRVLTEVRARMLSYGSFVWLQDLWGPGWWKQRLFNLALHAAVTLCLWALYREILRAIAPPPAIEGEARADQGLDAVGVDRRVEPFRHRRRADEPGRIPSCRLTNELGSSPAMNPKPASAPSRA